jgi:hypothetical protein
MPGPLAAGPIIVMLGGALLRLTAKQLPRYLARGAKRIKKPTAAQKSGARTPAQRKTEWGKRRTRAAAKEHIKRVQKESESKYTPRTDPGGYKDIYRGDEEGISRFFELKNMDKIDTPIPDLLPKKKGGGAVKGKQRGMGKALRGGGAVTRG